jgi:putative ABC transport system substrate-binding protein
MKRRGFICLVGVAAWPIMARAQQPALPVVGWLSMRSLGDSKFAIDAFHQGLKEAGYIVGERVAIEFHWAEHNAARLPLLAASLARRRVDVIAVIGSSDAAFAAKMATSDIPIVFANGADPVKVGLVESLNRPGGNLTGVTFITAELGAKRLELLHELVPQANLVGVMLKSGRVDIGFQEAEVRKAAETLGKHLKIAFVESERQIDSAFATFDASGVRALLVGTDPFFTAQRFRLAMSAAKYKIPAIYTLREYAEAGGLASYGASLTAAFRQAGVYAGRILSGAKPSELPVVQPTTLELVINLKSAKQLDLHVPPTLLARADAVIE